MKLTDLPVEERTLGRLLELAAATYGDRVFVRCRAEAVTYREAEAQARRAARALAGTGISHGARVAIMLPNCLEFLYVWFGIARLGAVEVPINSEFKSFQMGHVLNDSQCSVLVIDAAYLPRLAELAGKLPHLETVIVRGSGAPGLDGVTCHDLGGLLAAAPDQDPPARVSHADLLAIVHTSGTTGPSKGVMVCHHHEYVLGRNIARDMELGPADVFYNFYPLFHNTAQGIITWAVLQVGCTMVLRDRFSASNFWREVRAYGCTTFYYMGAILRILLETAPDDVGPGSHPLRVAWGIAAGAEEFTRFRDRFGVPLRGGYGSTEANIPCFLPWDNPKPGSSGRVLPGWSVRIADAHDRPLGSGQIGEIVVRPDESYCMMQGYFNRPEATVEAWRNLWFHTGDAGYFDDDGDLFFVDRIRDVIRRRGENISSYEVETVVQQFDGVLEAAAIAVPAELGEDEVKVVILPKQGADLDLDDLVRHCEGQLAAFAVPRYFEVVAELPKTETDKVKKHVLRERGFTPTTWDRVTRQYCR